MNKTTWKIEAIAIVIILAVEPTADAVNIIRTTKCQYTTWLVEGIQQLSFLQIVKTGEERKKIIKEIQETENKTLVVSKTIGFTKVMYWKHTILDRFYVKNDSILIHYNSDDEIVYYHKKWTDINVNISNYIEPDFEPLDNFWKELVIFPDVDDCKNFYTFNQTIEYPTVCWEVRHTDGTTKMYNSQGDQIGYGVPAPSDKAFTMSGYDKDTPHDPWSSWRGNANKWFGEWFETVNSIGIPSNEQVSYYLSDPNTEYFYEIAHSGGEPTRFQTSGNKVYYTVDQLRQDMENRDPITLAILCSCEAMQRTDAGTLSYEFRKGQTKNTITIGYVGMGSCPGWVDSLDWQNCMFLYMDRGFTIKNAFEIACALYPEISDCVKFIGDEKTRIKTPVAKQVNNLEILQQVLKAIFFRHRYSNLIPMKSFSFLL